MLEHLEWWHWVAFGLFLLLLELATTTFFALWFGLAAMTVGLILWWAPLSLDSQIFLWATLSVLATGLWFRFFKNPSKSSAGLAKESLLGVRGIVSQAIDPQRRGEVLFQAPVVGADRWPAIADEAIAAGERAEIVDVMGQVVKVRRIG